MEGWRCGACGRQPNYENKVKGSNPAERTSMFEQKDSG